MEEQSNGLKPGTSAKGGEEPGDEFSPCNSKGELALNTHSEGKLTDSESEAELPPSRRKKPISKGKKMKCSPSPPDSNESEDTDSDSEKAYRAYEPCKKAKTWCMSSQK